jgi:hypothetical protein
MMLPGAATASCFLPHSRTVERAGQNSTFVITISSKIRLVGTLPPGQLRKRVPGRGHECGPDASGRAHCLWIILSVAGRFARDPISIQFDAAAAALLRRAYTSRGEWAGTYVKNPSAEWQLWALRNGWGRLLGPDDAPGGDARTRWCRALVRSCHNLNRKFMTSGGLDLADAPRPWGVRPPYVLKYQVGTVKLSQRPDVRVIGRAFRVKLLTQAEAARFAREGKIPDGSKWIDDDGHPGPRYAGWTYQG